MGDFAKEMVSSSIPAVIEGYNSFKSNWMEGQSLLLSMLLNQLITLLVFFH